MSCTGIVGNLSNGFGYSAAGVENTTAPADDVSRHPWASQCLRIIRFEDETYGAIIGFPINGLYSSGGQEGPDFTTALCTRLPGSALYPTLDYDSGGGDYPLAQTFILLIETGGFALLIGNADGVAGTADDRKLFLF